MTPDQLIVSAFLVIAGLSFLLSPMPPWVQRLLCAAFCFVAAVYAVDAIGLISMSEKAFLLRYSLIVMSLVIIICIAAWRMAGGRVWRRK